MKYIFLLLLLSTFSSNSEQQPFDFSKLLGTWKRQNTQPAIDSYEIWQLKSEKYEGLGVSLKQGDTTFIENLKLAQRDGKWFYVADVSHNSTPTYFEVTLFSKNGFVSENPAHDFPKRIEYQLEGSVMNVTISGNGKSIPFVFHRTD